MNYVYKKLAILIFIGLVNNIFGIESLKKRKILLWDLGHVLLMPNQTKMACRYILPKACGFNPWNLVRLGMLYKEGYLNSKDIQNKMDQILDNARQHEERQTCIVNQRGIPHANIDCDHLNGICSNKVLYEEIQKSFKDLEEKDKQNKDSSDLFFVNNVYKSLLEAAISMRFLDPKFYGESFIPISHGVELLKKCSDAGVEMAILSNWDAESFPFTQGFHRNNIVFSHFKPENMFVSGFIKISKPYTQAFEYVVKEMNAKPEDFIFIDDLLANVEAARSIGMHGIQLTDYKNPKSYEALEKELEELGIL